MPRVLKKTVQAYQHYPAVIYRIILFGIPLLTFLWSAAFFFPGPLRLIGATVPLDTTSLGRLLFLSYALIWMICWAIYFMSRREYSFARARTLRRLLMETSAEWASHDYDDKKFFNKEHKYYEEMSGKSLTAIAVMVGASLIIFTQIHMVGKNLPMACMTSPCDYWPYFLVWLAVLSGAYSFIGFILSLDLLDSIFINYKSNAIKQHLQHYFFTMMINLRYPALIGLLTSSILIIAYYHTYTACFVIALYLVTGYSNWFPDFGDTISNRWERSLTRILLMVMLSLPFILWLAV